jgi:hypothetical protein
MYLPKIGGSAEPDRDLPQKRKKRRWPLVVATLLICLIGGTILLFSTGPVRVPLLGSLLAYQGTRGPVHLSVAYARLDFTAPDGINIEIADVLAEIDGPSPVRISLPKITAPINREALLDGDVHFTWLDLDKAHVRIELAGGPAKVPELEPLMEAVDRISDVVDDQFARRGLRFVRIRNASVALEGTTPRRFNKIEADIFRGEGRTIRAFAKVEGNVSTWRMELARSAPPGAHQKQIGVVVNGITLAELLGSDAGAVQGKGLGLPASAKIESRLSGEGKFLYANAVARMRDGWFQLGRTIVAFDDAALSLLFRRGQREIEVTTSHVIRGNTRIPFSGSVVPGTRDVPEWTIDLTSEFPQFGSSDVPEAPHMLEDVQVQARFDPGDRLLTVDRFFAKSGKSVVQGAATVEITPEGPYLAIAAEGAALGDRADQRRSHREGVLYGRAAAAGIQPPRSRFRLVGRRHADGHDLFRRCRDPGRRRSANRRAVRYAAHRERSADCPGKRRHGNSCVRRNCLGA